jgi:hypothetical protein
MLENSCAALVGRIDSFRLLGIERVGDVARATDDELDAIDYIGDVRVKQI